VLAEFFIIRPGELYKIRLSKNTHFTEISILEKDSFNLITTVLRKVSILATFHDDYEIIGDIDRSRIGSVFRAISKLTSQKFAVKVINKEQIYLDNTKYNHNSILNEVEVLKMVSHRNLLDLHEVHECKDFVYIITELIEGPTVAILNELCKPIPEYQLIELMKEVIRALTYLHKRGIIHRNILPTNLIFKKNGPLLSNNNGIVLLGYSNCSFYLREENPVFGGTIGFSPPESLHYDTFKYTNNTTRDVWGLGALLYFMSAKQFPFSAPGSWNNIRFLDRNFSGEVFTDHRSFKQFTKPCKIRNYELVRELIEKMLSTDPHQRPTLEEISEHAILNLPSTRTKSLALITFRKSM